VMNDHRSSDVHITEADGLPALQTDQEVNGWVGIRGGELPDSVGKAGIIVLLTLTLFFGRLRTRSKSRITPSSMSDRRCLWPTQRRRVFTSLLGVDLNARGAVWHGGLCFRGKCLFRSFAL
jgi:hypothetical protein